MSTDALPVAAGRVTFIRQVTIHGKIHLLSQTFSIGKRLKGQYVKVVLDTQHAHLTVYVKGRIFKRWTYPFFETLTDYYPPYLAVLQNFFMPWVCCRFGYNQLLVG